MSDVRFCPRCGGDAFQWRVPRRDDKERWTCDACGWIHYVGPALAAGAILHEDGARFCLVKRAWDPGRGKWSFPGGFVDVDETPEAAAVRETEEETGCRARLGGLVGLYPTDGPRGRRVVIAVYEATVEDERGCACEEVEEVRWFARAELPWDELAFASTATALRAFTALRPGAG